MSEQAKALELATNLEVAARDGSYFDRRLERESAAELRRLHSVNAELLEALRQLVTLEADGWHADENSIEAWEQARAAVARALGQ